MYINRKFYFKLQKTLSTVVIEVFNLFSQYWLKLMPNKLKPVKSIQAPPPCKYLPVCCLNINDELSIKPSASPL